MGQEMVKEAQEPLETVDPSESVPDGEVLVAGEVEEKTDFDFSPMENKKILERLNSLAKNLSKIGDYYRNPGKTPYCAFRCGNMKGICFFFLAVKSARVSVGRAIRNDKDQVRGEFPKDMYYRITEDGIFTRDKESITQKEIIGLVRSYKSARGW